MNLFALLHKAKASLVESQKSITSFKESAFESYARHTLFPADQYTLLEQTFHPASIHDDRKTCLNPAFKFLDKRTNKVFWLEVKARNEDYDSRIHWCSEVQLQRYLSCHKKTPTFLLLGISRESNTPHALYLLSMTQARYTSLHDSCIRHFEIPKGQPLCSGQLWNR